MVCWQRHLHSVLRRLNNKVGHSYTSSSSFGHSYSSSSSFSSCGRIKSSLSPGESNSVRGLLQAHYLSSSRPLYQYLQQLCISSSKITLANSPGEVPGSSPLSPALLGSGKAEEQKSVVKPSKVQAVLKGIKQSPKKVNLVAALVRGMHVEDALLQLQVTVKRAAKTVYQVIHSARANATHNHGLIPDRLLVAEAFVGKGLFKKRLSYHAKGKCGIKVRPECRLTVVVREMTAEEEAEMARLKVSNFRKLTKRERQLVPHKLIETTPIWNRKGKSRSSESSMAA